MPDQPTELIARLQQNISRVVLGKADVVRLAVVALLAGEHVLLEDVPGVGKTLMGKAIARSLAGEFRRIQFTPDLLPADIPAAASTTARRRSSSSPRARSSPTSCWPTRSTAPRPARKARCWRR